MAEITTRRGVVLKVEPGRLVIRVSADCHCEGCSIMAFCGTKSDDDTVTLESPEATQFTPGDVVQFEPSTRAQWKSILIAFVVPMVILLGVVLVTLAAGLSELIAALAGGVACVLYFVVLKLTGRRHIDSTMNWTISHYRPMN